MMSVSALFIALKIKNIFMTDYDWAFSEAPQTMLDSLKLPEVNSPSDRKLRLISVAIEEAWERSLSESFRNPISYRIAEAWSDGHMNEHSPEVKKHQPECWLSPNAWHAAHESVCFHNMKEDRPLWASIIREILGNVLSPVIISEEHKTSNVLCMANHAYNTKDYSSLPIIADALEEAGCVNKCLLWHLRGIGPFYGAVYLKESHQQHLRGCWALDCILGRS